MAATTENVITESVKDQMLLWLEVVVWEEKHNFKITKKFKLVLEPCPNSMFTDLSK